MFFSYGHKSLVKNIKTKKNQFCQTDGTLFIFCNLCTRDLKFLKKCQKNFLQNIEKFKDLLENLVQFFIFHASHLFGIVSNISLWSPANCSSNRKTIEFSNLVSSVDGWSHRDRFDRQFCVIDIRVEMSKIQFHCRNKNKKIVLDRVAWKSHCHKCQFFLSK